MGAGVSFRAAVRVKARVGRVAVTAKLIVDPPRPELTESPLQLTTALLRVLETYCSNSPSRNLIRPQTDDVVFARPRSFGVRAERSRAVARAEVFSFSPVAHRLTERAANPVRAGRYLMERQRGQDSLL